MTALLVFSLAITVTLMVVLLAEVLPVRRRAVRQRLAEIESLGTDPHSPVERRRRLVQGERVLALLMALGTRLTRQDGRASDTDMLAHAGYRDSGAVAIYWGMRLVLALGAGLCVMLVVPPLGVPARVATFVALYFAAIGYVVPLLYVRARVRGRQKDLQHALPDTLDLLVVCVEAGLGLNLALVRVAEEVRHVSTLMSNELVQTNAEMRAGTPRDQALRALATRTGLEDLTSLVTMLIQTDRFGTSIATSLRVHSDTLRQKRRQRAEEAAAKTAIKMVFPLVFCIFPAMFVVILGPGIIRIFRALNGLI